jgi:hypothetical protein
MDMNRTKTLDMYNERIEAEMRATREAEQDLHKLRDYEKTIADALISTAMQKDGLMASMMQHVEKSKEKMV